MCGAGTKLLPTASEGRVALYELLVNTPAVANLIREGKLINCRGHANRSTGRNADFTQSFQQRVARVCYKRCFNIQFSYLSVVIVMFY